MDEKTMEKMAREYREILAAPNGDAIDRIVNLEEQQLDCLDDVLYRSTNRPNVNRAASYLKTLTYRILSLLATIQKETYLPSVRSRSPLPNPLSKLYDLQVDLFVLYDRLDRNYDELSELLSLENKKAALLCGIL